MKTWVVVLLVLVVLVVAAVGTGAWLFFKRPLTVFAWQTRLALRGAGLTRTTVDSPAGPQVVFAGGTGPAIVLLHGAGDQAGTWFKVAPDLVKKHRLIVPDLAGHGSSAPPAGPIDTGAVYAGVEAAIETLSRGEKVTIVGNSLGAWMALLVAHRHPDWVTRVVAVDGGATTGENVQARVLPRTREEARESVKQTRDPGSVAIPDFVLDDIVRQAAVGPLARFAATAATMSQWTLDGHLSEVKVPVDLVWGESDHLMPLDYARRMLTELPHARLVAIPRCGHVPQVECPSAFLAALRQVLEEEK